MDGSHGYLSVPMVDEQWVVTGLQLRIKNICFSKTGPRTKQKRQRFKLMRQNLNPVIIADKWYQYVDDIGIGAHGTNDLLEKVRAVFTCIRESGMKLARDKCAFERKEIQFFGHTVNSEGLTPKNKRLQLFWKHSECYETQSKSNEWSDFFNFIKLSSLDLLENFNRSLVY